MENEKGRKLKLVVYIVIRVFVVLVMAREAWHQDWNNVFLCALTLVLLMLPSILSKHLALQLPNALEIIIVIFIFAAEVLGEINGFYVIFPNWDTILHTTNGFLAAAIGIALVDVLNRQENVKLTLSPIYVAVAAFCFSMTVGVIWEFFEFGMDYFFGLDMQKDTWLSSFNSVALNSDGLNVPVHVDVDSVVVNGQQWQQYLDIGLYDTMEDLFVNFIGAVVFSVIGFIYIKNRGRGLAAEFVPTVDVKKLKEIEIEEQQLKQKIEAEEKQLKQKIEQQKQAFKK